ncbi:hypothetical protein [Acidovorax sp. SRB_14]|uniref:hypothetical protein n=1 Tax=Acidovorax sp. SRB_14 TaxID=1962699 RepID=UPI0015644DCA|nr:hypothetical protein [Acidovorax sp. SRB_14]
MSTIPDQQTGARWRRRVHSDAFKANTPYDCFIAETVSSLCSSERQQPLHSNHRNRPSEWLLWVADSTGRCDMAGPFFACVSFVEASASPTPEPCRPVYAAIVEDAQVELSQANA